MQRKAIFKEAIKMGDLTTKDIRKMAFAVGFGLTLGKSVAKLVDVAIGAAVQSVAKIYAKKGNEIAQDICKKANIIYEEKPEEDETKMKMGFHC